MLYCAYRAVRLQLDRRTLLIHEHGLRIENRRGADTLYWEDLSVVTAVHLGDAIDEDAIDFEFNTPRKKLRITRAQFPLIEQIWMRILQAAEEPIQLAHLDVRTHIQSRRPSAV